MLPSNEALLLLVGPIITLVYPIYASIRAVESSSSDNVQQWLTYWVLFTLIRLLELFLGRALQWFLIWPYAKVAVTFWLVLPYFGGAADVYEHYLRPCFSLNPQYLFVRFISRNENVVISGSSDFLMTAERYILENGADALVEVITKAKSKAVDTSKEDTVPSPLSPKKAQREWTCVLCVVSTTSESDLRMHLQGRKHKAKEQMQANNTRSKHKGGLSSLLQATDMTDLVEDFNQIKQVFVRNLKRHIIPFARPLRSCTWEKPKFGWTKLNTDGSKDLKKAGLGGLLRDHLGCPKCAFVSKAPQDDIFSLEIWAIWRGLILALSQGVTAVWVESDSMSVVQVIKKEWPYPLKDGSCLKRIWKLLDKFEKYQVSHSWREANRAADHLAKMNLKGRDVVLWPEDFSESLWSIIKEDAEGKIYLRL